MHKKDLTLITIMTEKKVLELSISNYSCTLILASVVGGNAEQIT